MASETELKNLQSEIDRLRILLQKVTQSAKSREGFRIEIEPSPKGFAIVVTGYSKDQEWRVAEQCATYLNTLALGGMRWSVSTFEHLAASAEGEIPGLATTSTTASPDEGKR